MVKKIISAAAAVAIVFGTAAALPQGVFEDFGSFISASAANDELTEGFWKYTVNDDGTATLRNYTGVDIDITLPSKIGERPVTAIGKSMFENNKNIGKITIPSSITTIGYRAFKGSSLTSIVVPSTVTTWGNSWGTYEQFMNCKSLTSITINNTSVPDALLKGCDNLKTVTLASSVKTIGNSAFEGDAALSSITLGGNITSIGDYAFSGTTSLKSIDLGSKLEYIGVRAFKESGLTSINVPSSVKTWGDSWGTEEQFMGCKSLETVTLATKSIPNSCFRDCEKLKTVNLGNRMRTINNNAFLNCGSLSNLIITTNLHYIGEAAFKDCGNLTSFNFGRKISYIGYDAFVRTSLSEVYLPSGVSLADYWGSGDNFYQIPTLKLFKIGNPTYVGDRGIFDKSPDVVIYTIKDSLMYNYAINKAHQLKTFSAIPSTSISFNKSSYTLKVGESLTFNPTVAPVTTTDSYTWFSGDSDIAEISTSGVLTAKKAGLVAVRVTTSSGKYATCSVNVVESGTSDVDSPAKMSISSATITNIATQKYTGSEIKPRPYVMLNDCTRLVEGEDFAFSYSNNIKTGTATVTVTGKGDFTGTISKNFTIADTDLTKGSVTLGVESTPYIGSAITPAVTVKNSGGVVLTKDTDYTVAFKDNVNVGTATVTVTGKGKYTGSLSKTFKITAVDISKASITGVSDKAYTGSAIAPTVTVSVGGKTLKNGTDYTVAYSNNTNAGKAKVTVTGKGNYTGKASKEFNITKVSIAKATVSGIANKTYTGKALTQAVTVKVGSKTLKAGTDYTVTYKNNKAIGKATVTITGKGNYQGTISKAFKINPKKTAVKKVTSPKTKQIKVTYSKVAGVTGYEIAYSTTAKFTKATTKTVAVKGTSKAIGKLTKGKTYYVKVRTYKTVSGTKYYSGYSAAKKIKVK